LEIAAGEELVGHRAEKLLGFERVEALRPVPPGVANVAERVGEARRVVPRDVRGRLVHARNVDRVSPRSLLSLRLRWSPSSTNSILPAVDATTAGRSLMRGTTLVSPLRSARFRAAETRFS